MIRLGTRKSPLAVVQTNLVVNALKANDPNMVVEIVPIETRGDKTITSLAAIGGKALFSKELQQALLDGQIDGAVHSCKDIECHDLPLVFGAFLPRARANDVLITRQSIDICTTDKQLVCGTCAPRRKVLMQNLYPHLSFVDLRGNVATRLQKVNDGVIDVTVLASAGLKRLGYHTQNDLEKDYPHLQLSEMSVRDFPPAAGQGIIAIECLAENQALFTSIDDKTVRQIAMLERSFVQHLDGHCRTAIGAHIYYDNAEDQEGYHFVGLYEGHTQHVYLGRDAAALNNPTTALAILDSADELKREVKFLIVNTACL